MPELPNGHKGLHLQTVAPSPLALMEKIMAQTNFTTYTQTCDRCGKTDTSNSPHGLKLTGLYVYANRPSEFQSDLCNHLQLLEMCDDCLNAALTAIGPKAVEAYRNHQESMRRYQSYR